MLIKSVSLILVFILLMVMSVFAWAKYHTPMLVLDMRNAPQLPKYFRSVNNSLPANINTMGLADLFMAGGAQFSKSSLAAILNHLHTKKLSIIDLRQEPHGMLNSNAVSWYGHLNAENTGKQPAQIEEEQAALLKALGEKKVAVVDTVLQKSPDGGIKKVKPIEYLVHQTLTEEEMVKNMNHGYHRIYVQDFHAPAELEVDRFLEIMKNIPKDRWIYFHCRAGMGRTTVFMALLDILRNAKTVSLEDILDRQTALGGKDLRELPAHDHFKHQWAVERIEFIKKFYQYAYENKDNYHTSWSAWLKMHAPA